MFMVKFRPYIRFSGDILPEYQSDQSVKIGNTLMKSISTDEVTVFMATFVPQGYNEGEPFLYRSDITFKSFF